MDLLTATLAIIGTLIIGFTVLFLLLKKSFTKDASSTALEDTVNKVFGLTTQKIAEQARQVLEAEKSTIRVDLENKHNSIERLVKTLQDDMKERQDEIRLLEQDRVKKFSEITTTLDQHRRMADELRISTQQLASVLSNNQLRGEWGERIIEDLLKANGLIEGVHYAKQARATSSALRPDITLLLPNHRNVPVDVKFPYAEIQKMSLTEDKTAKAGHIKQFASDLRVKVQKVAEYINPEAETLDYAILFVPNEMVFSFINQQFPEIIDEALAKRVIIVSPFTFLIVARTVIESYRSFMIEDRLKDILQYVTEFVGEWGKFQEEFAKLGRSFDAVKAGFEAVQTTRTAQMERKIKKIESSQHGTALKKLAAPSKE